MYKLYRFVEAPASLSSISVLLTFIIMSWFGFNSKNKTESDQNDSERTTVAEATPLLASPALIATSSNSKQNVKPAEKALKVGDPIDNEKKNISLAQLRPFLEIAIPFFREDRAAFCSLIGIVVLTLLESALLIVFSYTRRDIFDALNNKQQGKQLFSLHSMNDTMYCKGRTAILRLHDSYLPLTLSLPLLSVL